MTEATITIEDAQSADPNKIIKIVHISGQLDESNVDEKIKDIYKILEENPKNLNLIIDLENLDYMNSKSIGYLTDLYGKITENSGQVAIAHAKPNITDILQVVGLTQLIQSYESVDAAKEGIANGTTPVSSEPAVEATPAPTPEVTAEAPVEPVAETTPETPAEPAVETTPEAPAPEVTAEPVAEAPAEPVAEVTPEAPAEPVAEATPETPAPEATPETPAEDGTYKFDQ